MTNILIRIPLATLVLMTLGLSVDAVDQPAVAETPFPTADFPFLGEDVLAARKAIRETEARIRAILDGKSISGQIAERPLDEAVQTVCRQAGIENSWIDEVGLQEEGISPKVLVTLVYRHSSPHQALRRLLQPHGLAYIIDEGGLGVTTQAKEGEKRRARYYNIRTLRKAFGEAAAAGEVSPSFDGFSPLGLDAHPEDARGLVDLITNETSGLWIDIHGDGGRLTVLGDLLLVRQTETVHREVAAMLTSLEELIAAPPGQKAAWPSLMPGETAQVRRVMDGLARKPGPLAFQDTPLGGVLAKLSPVVESPIVLDEAALVEEGIPLDLPITFSGEGQMVATALRGVLEPRGLVAIVEDGVVLVTTTVKNDEKLETLMYDARTLDAAGVTDESLLNLLMDNTSGPWEDIHGDGGTGSVCLPGILVVRQTHKVQEEVADLLNVLREGAAQKDGSRVKRPAPAALVDRFYPLDRKGLAVQMSAALTEMVAPRSWEGAGGKGTLRRIDETLVVRQTLPVHRAIQRFLDDFKDAENRPAGTPTVATPRGF